MSGAQSGVQMPCFITISYIAQIYMRSGLIHSLTVGESLVSTPQSLRLTQLHLSFLLSPERVHPDNPFP